jgi:hypothetical protein
MGLLLPCIEGGYLADIEECPILTPYCFLEVDDGFGATGCIEQAPMIAV